MNFKRYYHKEAVSILEDGKWKQKFYLIFEKVIGLQCRDDREKAFSILFFYMYAVFLDVFYGNKGYPKYK